MTPRIGVLLVDLPKMLDDIVTHAIGQAADFHLIRESAWGGSPYAHRPDAVIAYTGGNDDPRLAFELLAQWPTARILLVADRGERVVVYQLQPERIDLGELSPTRLVQALRSAVHSSAGGPEWRQLHQP